MGVGVGVGVYICYGIRRQQGGEWRADMCADTSMYICAHRAGLERYVWWSALLPAVLPICISLMASTAWVRAHTHIHSLSPLSLSLSLARAHTCKAVFACGAD